MLAECRRRLTIVLHCRQALIYASADGALAPLGPRFLGGGRPRSP